MSSAVLENLGRLHITTGNIVYTTGVPALTTNDGSATVADTGTGIATITFGDAFSAAPTLIAQYRKGTESAAIANIVAVDSVTTTTAVIRFKALDGGGTNATADPADTDGCWFVVIGFRNN